MFSLVWQKVASRGGTNRERLSTKLLLEIVLGEAENKTDGKIQRGVRVGGRGDSLVSNLFSVV